FIRAQPRGLVRGPAQFRREVRAGAATGPRRDVPLDVRRRGARDLAAAASFPHIRRPGRQPHGEPVMPWWLMAVLVFGMNFALWGAVGLCRLLDMGAARLARRRFARRFSGIREVGYTGADYPEAWPGPGGGRSPGAMGRPGR